MHFKLKHGLIFLKATIEEKCGYLIFDTGSPITLLNNAYFSGKENLDIEMSSVFGKIDSVADLGQKFVKIDGLFQKKLKTYSSSFTHLEKVFRMKIFGILGYNAFSKERIYLDYKKRNIFFLTDFQKINVLIKQNYKNLHFRLNDHAITFPLFLNDEKYEACFDTGANACLFSKELKEKIGNKIFLLRPVKTLSVNDEDYLPTVSIVPEMRVGSALVKNVVVSFISFDEINEKLENLKAIIGWTFFRKLKLIIDYCEKVIYFIK